MLPQFCWLEISALSPQTPPESLGFSLAGAMEETEHPWTLYPLPCLLLCLFLLRDRPNES